MNCIFEVNSFCQSVNCAVYYKHVIQVGDLCITMRGLTQILVNCRPYGHNCSFVRNRIALFFYPYLKYIEIYFILKLNNVLMSEY